MASSDSEGLSKEAIELIEGKNFADIATLLPDGSPTVTPQWVDHENGKYVLVNTLTARVKAHNVARDPRVALSIHQEDNPYHKVTIRGKVIGTVTGPEAEKHMDNMSKKYLGQDKYPWRKEGEHRIILRIKPHSEHFQ